MLPDVDVNAVTRDDDPHNRGPNTCSRHIFGQSPNYTFYYIHVNAIDVPPDEKAFRYIIPTIYKYLIKKL